MIKNFQLFLCPDSFTAEGEVWRTVIHLNLARFVNYVLHVIFTTSPKADPNLRMLQMRLSPLKQVELILSRAISAETSQIRSPISPMDAKPSWRTDPAPEITIRGGSGWKTLMKRRRAGSLVRSSIAVDDLDDARRILDACKDDIVALWKNHGAKVLEEEGVDLHHHAR